MREANGRAQEITYRVFQAGAVVGVTEDSEFGRLDVIVGMTLFVQPIFLIPQLIMFFYVLVGVEGTKVFARTRAWQWAMGMNVLNLGYYIGFADAKEAIDQASFDNYGWRILAHPHG